MDIFSFLPVTSISGAVVLLINAVIAAVAIMLSDKIIAHEMNAKHAFMIAIVSLFITPIVGGLIVSFVTLPAMISGIFSLYLLPLIVWLALGEILLKSDMKTKLKVIVIAFVVYTILTMFLGSTAYGFVSGFLP